MPRGRVLRSFSNIFQVDVGGEVWECRPRGRLRRLAQRVMAGDLVEVSPAGPGLGAIDEVLPRRSELTRPPVANVDRVVLVFSLREPVVDLALMDRFLAMINLVEMPVSLCLNKTDLAGPREIDEIRRVYEPLVDRILGTSAVTGDGLDDLRDVLSGCVSVMAGPSGVGKSSLLNALDPALALRTGRVSRKALRGTHTTRDVALLPAPGEGLVADTPGFTHLEVADLKPADVPWLFPEIGPLGAGCRFRGCFHRAEPDCRVKEAVARGEVDPGRYERYLGLLSEVEKTRRSW